MHRSPMGADSIQQFVTMGAARAWHQLSVLQGDHSKSFEVHHQPTPVTTVHATEEERGKRRGAEEFSEP